MPYNKQEVNIMRNGNTLYRITEKTRMANEWIESIVGELWLNPDDIPMLKSINRTLNFQEV